ncbi:regulatory signaling modulator protein AmpE [Celerinatantimonas yamalensis]|uniref:Regulatory signaling modulator protein AmpE n=1 Tax=Celerinatantimonas yamalensis TaxID=559956 RepID=A0ABW9G551_9GAMM
MSLIALILALVLERTRHYRSRWFWHELAGHWFTWLPCRHTWSWMLFGIILPTSFIALLQWAIQGWLFGFCSLLLWVILPLLVLGCPELQSAFRDYLQLGAQDPRAACQRFNQKLTHLYPGCASKPLDSLDQTSQFLCWLNFRYYFAVVFWFSVGGPAFAAGYGLLRSLQRTAIDRPDLGCQLAHIIGLMHCLDWLPSRLSGLSYVLSSGSFKGFKVWLTSLHNISRANADWLGSIAMTCRQAHEQKPITCNEMTIATVHLLKSSLLLTLVIIALLTLYGWLI